MVSTSGLLQSFPHPINAIVNGASRGIGLAFVRRLVDDPNVARVFATSRQGASDAALKNLRAGENSRLQALDMDVTVGNSVATAAAAVCSDVNQVELIINCAGLLHDSVRMRPEKRLADITASSLQRSYAVNAVGPLLIAKHFEALLPRHGRCVFANLSARVGSIGDNRLGGWYAYRASKAAQNMITRNLSIELHRRARGIICVALHPGTVDTSLSRPFQSNVSENQLFSPDQAAHQLLSVIDGLHCEDNGRFFAWDAKPIPW